MEVAAALERAQAGGYPVRLHTREGEVVVARVLAWDGARVRYVVIHSSRPERYAVCDSTGFELAAQDIERASVLSEAQAQRQARRRG
jgi:hypothetical protein